MSKIKQHPNKLGIIGWLGGGRWGMERYIYSLHRITGLGILLYFILHIFVTSIRAFGGEEMWIATMSSVTMPIFKIGEFLVFTAFAIHGFNGIRLILIELGFAVGKAEDPVYPYQSSVNVQRPLSIVMMVLAVILILTGGVRFFFLH